MNTGELSTSQMSQCRGPLPDLEIPMINTMVNCLGSEHRKLDERVLQLALAASRLANHPGELTAKATAVEAWNDIRRELWSHLQIEDELVFSWGKEHQAISPALLDALKIERQEMRRLMTALSQLPPVDGRGAESVEQYATFARILIALAQNLDSHVERYDADVLPSILRVVFHQ
jgi:iron-sulfur cluster repair protein YtfE (RIC family)